MNVIRLFVAMLLLVFSAQSMALFMPADSRIETDNVSSNNVGC